MGFELKHLVGKVAKSKDNTTTAVILAVNEAEQTLILPGKKVYDAEVFFHIFVVL